MVIFLDTYAIIAIDTKSSSYDKYSEEEAVTSIFNIAEAYFVYLRKFSKKEADEMYEITRQIVIPIDDPIIKEAMEFKLQHLKKRLSFADCIGYITALKLNVKFVTGDYAFKEMENVEFVK